MLESTLFKNIKRNKYFHRYKATNITSVLTKHLLIYQYMDNSDQYTNLKDIS